MNNDDGNIRPYRRQSEQNFLKYNPGFRQRYAENPEAFRVENQDRLMYERHYECNEYIYNHLPNEVILKANMESRQGNIDFFKPYIKNMEPDIVFIYRGFAVIIDFTYTNPRKREEDYDRKLKTYNQLIKEFSSDYVLNIIPLAFYPNMEQHYLNTLLITMIEPVELIKNLTNICQRYNKYISENTRSIVDEVSFKFASGNLVIRGGEDLFTNFEEDFKRTLDYWCKRDDKYKSIENLMRIIGKQHENNFKYGSELDEVILDETKKGQYDLFYEKTSVSTISTEFEKLVLIKSEEKNIDSRVSIPLYIPSIKANNVLIEELIKEKRPELYELLFPQLGEDEKAFYKGMPMPKGSAKGRVLSPQTVSVNKSVKESIFGVKKVPKLEKEKGVYREKENPISFKCNAEENKEMLEEIKRLSQTKDSSMHIDMEEFLRECMTDDDNFMDNIRTEAANLNIKYLAFLDNLLTSTLYYLSKLSQELLCQDFSQVKGCKKFILDEGHLILEGPGGKLKQYQTSRPFIHLFSTPEKQFINKRIYGVYEEYKKDGFYIYISEPRSYRSTAIESQISSVPSILSALVVYGRSLSIPSYDIKAKSYRFISDIDFQTQLREVYNLFGLVKLFSDPGVTDLLTYQRYFFMSSLSEQSNSHSLVIDKLSRPTRTLFESFLISNSHQNFMNFKLGNDVILSTENKEVIYLNMTLPFYPSVNVFNSSCFVELMYTTFFGVKKSKKPCYSYWDTLEGLSDMNEKFLNTYQNKNLDEFDTSLSNLQGFNCNYSILFRACWSMNVLLAKDISTIYSENFLYRVNSYTLFDSASTKSSLSTSLRKQCRFESIIEISQGEDLNLAKYFRLYSGLLTEPLYVEEMLKPEWNYDDREAWIGDIHSMTQLKVFEDFFRSLCEQTEIEMISKSGLEKNQKINSSVNRCKSKDEYLYQNIDKTKWNMFWDFEKNITIISSLRDQIPRGFFYYLLICCFKLKNKFVKLPIKITRNIASTLFERDLNEDELKFFLEKNGNTIREVDIVEFFSKYAEEVKQSRYRNFIKTHYREFFRIEWGFLAGFVNFMSSYAHTSVSKYVEKILSRRGIETVINYRHSDDAQLTTKFNSKFTKDEFIDTCVYTRRIIEENCQMRDSVKKTTVSSKVFEFLSQYFISKKYLYPFIKSCSVIDDSLPFSGYISDISAAGGFCSDLYSIGLEDLYSTSLFLLFQYNIRCYYSPRFMSGRSLSAKELYDKNTNIMSQEGVRNYLVRGTVESVLNSLDLGGNKIIKTMLPPQLFGICPLTASCISSCTVSSWYSYIYEKSEKTDLFYINLLQTIVEEKCFLNGSLEEVGSSEVFSPGTFPLPTINLRFESRITEIRKKYLKFKNEVVNNLLENPQLTLIKSSDPKVAFAQIIARLYTKGFRETFSLDSLSKVTRAIKSNNTPCVAVFDVEEKQRIVNIYNENFSYDEFYTRREEQRSLDIDLFENQHLSENGITFIPYKVYVFFIFYKALEVYNKCIETQELFIDETIKLRCTISNSLCRDNFSIFLGQFASYDTTNNSVFFPTIPIHSDDLKMKIPHTVLTLFFIDEETSSRLFSSYAQSYKSRKEEIISMLGTYNPETGRTSKGLSGLECSKIFKDLGYKSRIMCSKMPNSNILDMISMSTERKRIYTLLHKAKLSATSSLSLLSSKFYTTNQIIAMSMNYGTITRLYPHKLEDFMKIINKDRVLEPSYDSCIQLSRMVDRFAYCFFYDVVMKDLFKSTLHWFTKDFLTFDIVSSARLELKNGFRVGTLKEFYKIRGELVSVFIHIEPPNSKDRNLFCINLNSNSKKEDIYTIFNLLYSRHKLSCYWNENMFRIDDTFTKINIYNEKTGHMYVKETSRNWVFGAGRRILEGKCNVSFLREVTSKDFESTSKYTMSQVQFDDRNFCLVLDDYSVYNPKLHPTISITPFEDSELSEFRTVNGVNLINNNSLDDVDEVFFTLGSDILQFALTSFPENKNTFIFPYNNKDNYVQSRLVDVSNFHSLKSGDKEFIYSNYYRNSPMYSHIKDLLELPKDFFSWIAKYRSIHLKQFPNMNMFYKFCQKRSYIDDLLNLTKKEFMTYMKNLKIRNFFLSNVTPLTIVDLEHLYNYMHREKTVYDFDMEFESLIVDDNREERYYESLDITLS